MPKLDGVSVVVVNYNGLDFLGECLDSLRNEKCVNEIIVVDNGSTDGSLEWLLSMKPGVVVLPAGENLGFARACNKGALVAQSEFLLFLNYDAVFHSGLETAMAHMSTFPGIGVVGGKIVYPDGRLQPSVGLAHKPGRLILSWLGLSRLFPGNPWLSREILDTEWYLNEHESVEWVSGALMLIQCSAWEVVSGMDPAFFLYVEDVDLCDRLKRAGFRLDYLPAFIAQHRKGGGAELVSARALLSTVDSYYIFLCKHHNKLIVRMTLLGIALVFWGRSMALALRVWRGAKARTEALTYHRGAHRAFSWGLGHVYPWGPPV